MATESAEAMANLVAAAPGNSASVSRTEFSILLRMIQQMQNNMAQTHRLLASLSPDEVEAQPSLPDPMASSVSMSAFVPAVAAAAPRPAPATERKKPQKRKAEVIEEPAVLPDVPLTREEQELLTETINDLPAEHLGGVIQIIREAAPVGADEDEIDLDIDQLSYSTQRKLLHHVSKFVKKPKKPAKKAKTSATEKKGKGGSRRSTPVPTPAPAPPRPPAPAPASQPASKQPSTSDLFGLDEKDSDSDSSDGEDNKTPAPAPAAAAKHRHPHPHRQLPLPKVARQRPNRPNQVNPLGAKNSSLATPWMLWRVMTTAMMTVMMMRMAKLVSILRLGHFPRRKILPRARRQPWIPTTGLPLANLRKKERHSKSNARPEKRK